MTTSVYQQGGFGTAALFPNPVSSPRDPVSTDRVSPTGAPFQVFQGWNNNLTDDNFLYLGAGNWVLVASAVGSLTQLTGDTGTASPVAGSIQLVGGTNMTSVASGAIVTYNLNQTIVMEEIDANFISASGTDLIITQSPVMQANANTGAAPTGVAASINLMCLQTGEIMEQFIIGTQTIIAPRMTVNGVDIALDNTTLEGAEYNYGARANAKNAFIIGTDAAFFAEATLFVEDISGCLPLMVGFRRVEANNAVIATYTDFALIGLQDTTSSTNVVIMDELNAGGTNLTDTTDAWGGDSSARTLRILVSATGVTTYTIDGVAPTVTNAHTFDTGDVVMPVIHFLNGPDVAGEVAWSTWKVGFQAV